MAPPKTDNLSVHHFQCSSLLGDMINTISANSGAETHHTSTSCRVQVVSFLPCLSSWNIQHGRTQAVSGLEDRLSCLWNDVRTTSKCRDFSTWQQTKPAKQYQSCQAVQQASCTSCASKPSYPLASRPPCRPFRTA